MARKAFALRKQDHIIWPWALFVGLGMIFIAHAPLIPVVVGCVAVVALSVARAKWRERKAGGRGDSQ